MIVDHSPTPIGAYCPHQGALLRVFGRCGRREDSATASTRAQRSPPAIAHTSSPPRSARWRSLAVRALSGRAGQAVQLREFGCESAIALDVLACVVTGEAGSVCARTSRRTPTPATARSFRCEPGRTYRGRTASRPDARCSLRTHACGGGCAGLLAVPQCATAVWARRLTPRQRGTRGHSVREPTVCEEPFGLVKLEALPRGTPVVTRNWAGAPELVAHGAQGLPRSRRR
jgi:hypothetical protein